jgi:hypothetical protein
MDLGEDSEIFGNIIQAFAWRDWEKTTDQDSK